LSHRRAIHVLFDDKKQKRLTANRHRGLNPQAFAKVMWTLWTCRSRHDFSCGYPRHSQIESAPFLGFHGFARTRWAFSTCCCRCLSLGIAAAWRGGPTMIYNVVILFPDTQPNHCRTMANRKSSKSIQIPQILISMSKRQIIYIYNTSNYPVVIVAWWFRFCL
jgi:hypothetical protein